MIRIVEVQAFPCTKGAAMAHATLAPLPGERELKPVRTKFIRDLLESGRFASPSWARGRCLEDGIMYRFDGQHSSNELAGMEESDFPAGLMIQMATWEFDKLDEAADVFNMFNNPRSTRSDEDMMGVFRAAVPSLAHLSRKFLVNVGNAVHVRERERWDSGDEDALGPYPPRDHGMYFSFPGPVAVAGWLSRFQGTKNMPFLKQPVIVAEMIREWEINPVTATTFWTLVFTEEHPDPKHETRVLAENYRDFMKTKYHRQPQWKAKAAKAWMKFQTSVQTPVETSIEGLPFDTTIPVEPRREAPDAPSA